MFEGVTIVERLQQILDSEYANIALFALFAALIMLVILTITRSYRLLLLMLLVGQMFSARAGTSQGVLTLMRFAAMFALLFLALGGLGRIRAIPALMILYSIYMLALAPMSEVMLWGVQRGLGLLILVIAMIGATGAYTNDYERIKKVLAIVALAGLAWVCVNGLFGTSAGAERGSGESRFVGVIGGTGAAAGVGGLLPPFFLWGFLQPFKRSHRYVCLGAFVAIMPMLVYIGQRIGLFTAIIGSLPLLAMRLGGKRLVVGGIILVLTGVLSFQLLQFINPGTREFLMRKYFTKVTDTSGRAMRWEVIFRDCASSPFMPHGCGAANVFGKIQFGGEAHNSYLNIWYDGGLQALLLWFFVIGVTVWRCMKLLMSNISQDAKDTTRLLLGTMLSLAAVAFFEGSLDSPTNLNIGMFLLTLTLVDRLCSLYLASHPSLWEWRTEEGQLPGVPSAAGAY
jgi:O-antigen ligase